MKEEKTATATLSDAAVVQVGQMIAGAFGQALKGMEKEVESLFPTDSYVRVKEQRHRFEGLKQGSLRGLGRVMVQGPEGIRPGWVPLTLDFDVWGLDQPDGGCRKVIRWREIDDTSEPFQFIRAQVRALYQADIDRAKRMADQNQLNELEKLIEMGKAKVGTTTTETSGVQHRIIYEILRPLTRSLVGQTVESLIEQGLFREEPAAAAAE